MPSKITLALVACVAYRTASVMALPLQNSYDLTERDYADVDSQLEARMFDNDFEDFVVREVTAPPTADAPPVAAVPPAAAEPAPPGGAKTLASTTAPNGGEPHPHHHRHHHHHHHHHHPHSQNGPHHPHNNAVGSTGAGAKEAAVVSPKPDASTPAAAQAPLQVPPQDPTAPAPAISRRWVWLDNFLHGHPKPQAPSGAHLANVGPKAPAKAPAGSDLADPIQDRELPTEPASGAEGAPKHAALAEGSSKLETPAEGAPKPHELAAEGTKATKPRRHRHRQGGPRAHRTAEQIKADPTLTEKARRRALHRAALREKRLAHISEQAGESHQLNKHRLDTTTGAAKVAPEGGAAPVAPVAAPLGASRRR